MGGVHDEACDTYEADDKAVLGSVVLVLVLCDQAETGTVVSLALCEAIFHKYEGHQRHDERRSIDRERSDHRQCPFIPDMRE